MSIRRLLIATMPVALAMCALAGPAQAATLGEQVDRGTGVSGSTALWGADSTPRYVTDDGRFALYDYFAGSPSYATQTAAERDVSGVYLRDTVADTTKQLARGRSSVTGVTADGKTISIISDEALVPWDNDGGRSLYLFDVAAEQLTLAATDGPVRTTGAISVDGTAIVWTGAGGTNRRALADGTLVHLSDFAISAPSGLGAGVQRPVFSSLLVNRAQTSRDGRVVVLTNPGGGIVTARAGSASAPVLGDGGVLSADGARLAFTNAAGDLVIQQLSTGATTVLGTEAQLYGPAPMAFTPDGTRVVFASRPGYLRTVNVATRAVVSVAGPSLWFGRSTVLSSNLAFVLAADRHLWVVPTGTRSLPETADAPAAFAYVAGNIGCTRSASQYLFAPIRPTFTAVAPDAVAGTLKSAALTFRAASGATVGSYTLAPNASVGVPIGWGGGWTLSARVTLTDGRILTGSWTQRAYNDTPACQEIYL